MVDNSLVGIFNAKKKLLTPAAAFVKELCEVTHRSELTVRLWLRGKLRPDINTQIIIAQHLNKDVATLFPDKS